MTPDPRHPSQYHPAPCPLPPPGWRCSRGAGHGGPCAAYPEATGCARPLVRLALVVLAGGALIAGGVLAGLALA